MKDISRRYRECSGLPITAIAELSIAESKTRMYSQK
jgi:hypothetical protein